MQRPRRQPVEWGLTKSLSLLTCETGPKSILHDLRAVVGSNEEMIAVKSPLGTQ